MIDDVNLIENEEEIQDEGTIEVIAVDEIEPIVISTSEAFPALGEDNDEMNHAKLYGRDFPDQHPISAITGLCEKIDEIESLKTVYSDKKLQADYYKWHDENTDKVDRVGYFVSIYPETTNIQICNDEQDVFGVTVSEAAFVGGQEYIETVDGAKIGRDRAFGLVVCSGLAQVRCELDVVAGDYVIPNMRGEAKKSKKFDEDSYYYGYLVVETDNIDDIYYATISLSAPSAMSKKTFDGVQDLTKRMKVAEFNITSAINVVNDAYANSVGAKEQASANSQYVQDKIEELSNKITETDELVSTFGESVIGACADAALAKSIATGAVNSADAIRGEAVASANEANKHVNDLIAKYEPLDTWVDPNTGKIGAEYIIDYMDNNGLATKAEVQTVEEKTEEAFTAIETNAKSIQSLVSTIAKYSVGEHSQSYGLSHDQAMSILKEGYIYVPTERHYEPHVANDIEFLRGYYYTWDGSMWAPSWSTAVSFSSVYIIGTEATPYWVVEIADVEHDGITYDLGGLYLWEDGAWTKVASVADNTLSRAVSAIKQTANEISAEITDAVGDAASLKMRLTNIDSSVTTLASHVIGDYVTVEEWPIANPDTETIYYVVNDETSYRYYKDGAWQETNNSHDAGLTGTMATLQQKADENGASISQVVEAVGENGEVTAASIVTAINGQTGDSVVSISADRINLNGSTVISGLQTQINNTVASTTIEYALSTSPTTAPTSGWSTQAPPWEEGQYMWQRTTITYTNTQKPQTITTTCIQGAKGEDGTGVVIQGTAYVESDISVDDNYIGQSCYLYHDKLCTSQIISADFGDSFLVVGYLFVYDHDDLFVCVGKIQGPQGQDGYTPQKGIDYFDGKDGYGIKKINTHVRQFTLEAWEGYGEIGNDEWWTVSGYDNSHINVGDTAYIAGIVTDTYDANNQPINAALYGVVTAKNNASIQMTTSYLMIGGSKGDDGSQGVGVTQVVAQYHLWSSSSTAPSTTSTNWTEDFDVVLAKYWSSTSADDKYIWYREKVIYSDNTDAKPHFSYTTPRVDTASSSIADWCWNNDKTIINGAHIGTGTIDALSINTDSLVAQIIDTGVLSAGNIIVSGSKSLETTLGDVDNNINSLQDNINNLSAGTVNLAAKKYVKAFYGNGFEASLTETDYVYTVVTKSHPGGIVINSDIFKPDAYYVLSFKFKFTDGIAEINGEKEKVYIAGHSDGFVTNKAILDGNEVEGDYPTGYEVTDPTSEHSISVYFKRKSAKELESIGQPELYIQPERMPNPDTFGSDATMQLWDLQITEGTIASAWSIPVEDAQEEAKAETQASIQNSLNGLQLGAQKQNLATSDKIGWVAQTTTSSNGRYTLHTVDWHHGLYIVRDGVFEVGKDYIVSYRFKDLYPNGQSPNIKVKRLGGHCAGFVINQAIVDGSIPVATETYDSGYTLAPDKTEHTITLYLTCETEPENPALYIQPPRATAMDTQWGTSSDWPKNEDGTPVTPTTSCEIWDLVVFEGSVMTRSWTSYQYAMTASQTKPDGTTTWTDSFPTSWKGSDNVKNNVVWRRTKITYANSNVTYGTPELLSTAMAATLAAEAAGQTLGTWCSANGVTIIDGANLMTGKVTAQAMEVDTLETITGNMGTLTTGKICGEEYNPDDDVVVKGGSLCSTTISGYNTALSTGYPNFDTQVRVNFSSSATYTFYFDFSQVLEELQSSSPIEILGSQALGRQDEFVELIYQCVEITNSDGSVVPSTLRLPKLSVLCNIVSKTYNSDTNIYTMKFRPVEDTTKYLYINSNRLPSGFQPGMIGYRFISCPIVFTYRVNDVLGTVSRTSGIISFEDKEDPYIRFPSFELTNSYCLIQNSSLNLKTRDNYLVQIGKNANGVTIQEPNQLNEIFLNYPCIGRRFLAYDTTNNANNLYTTFLINLETSTLLGDWNTESAITITSDLRNKHSIQTQPDTYSKVFDRLEPVIFKYNYGTSDRYHTGFIAQSVEQAVLDAGLTTQDFAAVCYQDNGGKKEKYSIRYEEIVSMCVYEIQKLKTRVAELETLTKQNG